MNYHIDEIDSSHSLGKPAQSVSQTAMSEKNTLQHVLKLHLSEGATAAFLQALAGTSDRVQIDVNEGYDTRLDLIAPSPELLEFEQEGVPFSISEQSVARAVGIAIEYKNGAMAGFAIDNPNAPPKVVEIVATELKARLDSGEFVQFFDVRTWEERELALISGTRLLDDAAVLHIEQLDRGTPLVFH